MNAPRRSSASSEAAFTLIELLVVISIIAVLAGMVLGGVKVVRERARDLACLNQQRQLGAAVLAYAADWEGMLVQQQPPLPGGSNTYWRQCLAQYLGIELIATGWNDPKLGQGVFRCPLYTDKPGLSAYDQSGYSWNLTQLGIGYGHGNPGAGIEETIALSRVRIPAETIGIADTMDAVSPGIIWNWCMLLKPSQTASVPLGDPVGNRHHDGLNIWWLDGHAARMGRIELKAGKGGQVDWYYLREK